MDDARLFEAAKALGAIASLLIGFLLVKYAVKSGVLSALRQHHRETAWDRRVGQAKPSDFNIRE